MPRNGAGVYSLPPSNPVIPATTIATAWANPTLTDVAQALTDSLDRNGLGGMAATFRLFDGTISAPGLAFTNELGLGIWRSGAGTMQMVSGGLNLFSLNATSVISPVKFEHRGLDTYKLTGSKSWRVQNDLGFLTFTPSTTVNGEDWDINKAFALDTLGNVQISADLDVTGTITAGAWGFVDITCNTLIVNDTQTVNGNFTCNAGVTAKQYSIAASASAGSAAVNFAISQSLVFTLAAPLTITSIAGLTLGNIGRLTIKNTAQGIVFPAVVKWPGPSYAPPSFSAGPLDIAIIVLEYDGTNYLANASVY